MTTPDLRKALEDVLNSSGARGRFHALEYASAVEQAEAALAHDLNGGWQDDVVSLEIERAMTNLLARGVSSETSYTDSRAMAQAAIGGISGMGTTQLLEASRDWLGRLVRDAWVEWAKSRPAPKLSWLVPYDELSEPDKEVDRQIGEKVARVVLAALPPPQTISPDKGEGSNG